ncbi:hypothetical protein ACFLQ6_03780 [Thermoproteota archaeon]
MVKNLGQNIRELHSLIGKKSSEDLRKAEQLMIELKKMGFTNTEISELTFNHWSEATIKRRTRGTKIDNPGPRTQAIELLNELIMNNLSLDDVKQVLIIKNNLDQKNITLNDLLTFLTDVQEFKIELRELLKTYEEARIKGLTPEQLGKIPYYMSELERIEISPTTIEKIHKTAETYGNSKQILEAITKFANLKQIEDNLTNIENETAAKQKIFDQLTQNIKILEEQKKKAEATLNIYHTLEGEGFDQNRLMNLKSITDKYGGIEKFLKTIDAFTNLLDIENSLTEIKNKKKNLESEYKQIKADHAHLQPAVKLCDELLYNYGFNIPALNTLLEISKQYGGIYKLMEAIGKYENITHLNSEIKSITDRKIALESNVKELQEQVSRKRSEVEELKTSITTTTNSISKQFINSTDKIAKTYETATETVASTLKIFQQDMTKTYTDSLKEITEKIPETASVIGAIDTKIERAKSLSLIIDLIEKPTEIKEPIKQVFASVISLVKGIELYTELNKDKIDKSMFIKGNLSSLHSELLETIKIEHKKTTTETQTKT